MSWWQPEPTLSLDLIARSGVDPEDPVIDVGAGSSTLADRLLERGFTDVTAVDVSRTALETVQARVGDRRQHLTVEVADVLDLDPGRRFALWHDRAVFHFLTEAHERDAYRASVQRSLRPGGWLIVATFGPEGPTACSGLPVARYSPDALALEFPEFALVHVAADDHLTPWGTHQQFAAVLMQHRGD